jgi:predicted aspartyl protease
MPILHIQFNLPGRAPDGSPVALPAKQVLHERGPIVQVTVGLMSAMAQQLTQQGTPIPGLVTGLALIDTGASMTCIDAAAASKIGAPVIDRVHMHSASHAATQANVYPVHFEILGAGIHIDAPRCVGAALASQGLVMLIGRDMLANCTLFYNGPSGSFTLSM